MFQSSDLKSYSQRKVMYIVEKISVRKSLQN